MSCIPCRSSRKKERRRFDVLPPRPTSDYEEIAKYPEPMLENMHSNGWLHRPRHSEMKSSATLFTEPYIPPERKDMPNVYGDNMASGTLSKDFNDKVNISVVGGTTLPCDADSFRSLRVSATDENNKAVNIKCVQLSDAGICVDMAPYGNGKYTLNLSYTFEVKNQKMVDAKFLLLDGRFSGLPDGLHQESDGSWVTSSGLIQHSAVTTESHHKEDIVAEMHAKKVSLAKQLTRQTTVERLVGATDVTTAVKKFKSVEDFAEIMKRAGLEGSNLIFGVDYTASNKTQGLKSFGARSLHSIDAFRQNPYQEVISIMGRTLASFSNAHVIPAFGFGDVKTSDHSVFSIQGTEGFCQDFNEVLEIYNTITPKTILSGPTNFAPIIREAIKIYQERPDYYILVIVADGQVNNEPDTVRAIVEACQYPISIVVVGVGDGPWEMMNEFDERIPARDWDNFNFVNYHMVTEGEKHPEAAFAVHALSEIPDQYATIKKLGLIRK